VTRSDGEIVTPTTSVRQGDSIPLELADENYVLHVRQLMNALFGGDFATIDVSRVPAAQHVRMTRLLEHIERSDVRFIREGQEYDGRAAAAHLRKKLAAAGPRINTADDFIEKIASRSSLTGEPYSVKLLDGTTIPAERWLKDELSKLEKLKESPDEKTPSPGVKTGAEPGAGKRQPDSSK
jgi:hypothetical protein